METPRSAQAQVLTSKNFRKERDCCYLTRTYRVCLVESYDASADRVQIKYFGVAKKCKSYPLDNTLLEVYVCSKLEKVGNVSVRKLKTKMFRMPFKKNFLCIPLCHNTG